MNRNQSDKIALISFSVLLLLSILLLSYKAALFFADLTPVQENVFAFLEGKNALAEGFTEAEVSHLEDVARVMKGADYVLYALLMMMAICLFYAGKNRSLEKLLRYGGMTAVSFILFCSIISFFFFDLAFTLFHALFFPQGNWMFAADSLLIQTFPLDFFITISRNIFLLALFLGILFILGGHTLQYVRDRN